MVLGKLDQKRFPFFREQSSAGVSDIFNNTMYGSLTLEISGVEAIQLKVQGCIKIEDADKNPIPEQDLEWSDLGLIAIKNFTVVETAVANGIYSVSIAGLNKVRVVIESVTGDATVIGVLEA